MTTSTPLLSSSSLTGNKVVDAAGEELGDIKDFMLDTATGKVEYAVLSFGGFLGLGDKYFAVPMTSMVLDTHHRAFVLDTTKEHLERAPGFDKDNWPDFASRSFRHQHDRHWAPVQTL